MVVNDSGFTCLGKIYHSSYFKDNVAGYSILECKFFFFFEHFENVISSPHGLYDFPLRSLLPAKIEILYMFLFLFYF